LDQLQWRGHQGGPSNQLRLGQSVEQSLFDRGHKVERQTGGRNSIEKNTTLLESLIGLSHDIQGIHATISTVNFDKYPINSHD